MEPIGFEEFKGVESVDGVRVLRDLGVFRGMDGLWIVVKRNKIESI